MVVLGICGNVASRVVRLYELTAESLFALLWQGELLVDFKSVQTPGLPYSVYIFTRVDHSDLDVRSVCG